MLQKLDQQICECLERAASADARAENEIHPDIRAEHLAIANKWRKLARSFEFSHALERFLLDARNGKWGKPPKAPAED